MGKSWEGMNSIFVTILLCVGISGVVSLAGSPRKQEEPPKIIKSEKSDKLEFAHRFEIEPQPKVVRTIPIQTQPIFTPPVVTSPPQQQEATGEPVPPPVSTSVRRHWHHHYVDHVDICTRHGLHKVFTKNGKGWRCRK
jgi:hypothetical protein